jgi:hypothetical protein
MRQPTTLGLGTCAALLMCAAGCFKGTSPDDAGAVDAATCSNLSPSAVTVQPQSSGTTDPVPQATGGALVAGDYHLVSSVYYPSANCSPTGVSTSLRVTLSSPTSGIIDTLTTSTAGGSVAESISFTTSRASLTLRLDCISPDPTGLGSTAAIIPYSVGDDGTIHLTTASPACGTSIDTYALD